MRLNLYRYLTPLAHIRQRRWALLLLLLTRFLGDGPFRDLDLPRDACRGDRRWPARGYFALNRFRVSVLPPRDGFLIARLVLLPVPSGGVFAKFICAFAAALFFQEFEQWRGFTVVDWLGDGCVGNDREISLERQVKEEVTCQWLLPLSE